MIEGGLTWQNGSWWWAVVLGVALLVAARLFLAWWRGRTARRLADSPLRGLLTAGVSPAARAVSAAAVLAAVALLGVAALRPQYGLEETEWTRKGLDVAIALDLSASMLTRDLEPDRLGASVLELEDLLGRLNGGRVGLVPFAGVAFQQCPLTSDFGAIRIYLRDLSPADLPVPGTAVGRALTEAMDLLGAGRAEEAGRGGEDEEILHPFQGSKYKVIVLITDGEDHGSEPLKVAERARDLGIRIYTLGVGDPRAGDLVPEVDADTGKPTGDRLTDEDTGEPVVSRLNEDLLRQIAELTDGAYFHYSGAAVAPALFEELDRLEKREVEATLEKLRKDRFQLLVAPALALLALGLALPGGRRRRGAVAAVLAVLALPACGLFETTNAGVDEANERYHAEAFEEAAEGLETLRDKIPEAPELHYDLGTARLAAGDLEGAVEAFQRALEKAPPPLEARIRANLGLAHLRAALAAEGADRTARLQQAVAALRDAVRLDAGPEEPRKNLELAVLHLSPPCERRQESWEPNDRITRPTHWTPEVGAADLLLCPSDQDFYTVQVPAGHRLQAWLAGPGGGAAAASPPASPPAPAAGSAAGDTAPEAPPLPPRGSPPAGVSLELVEGASGLADSASLPASPDGTLITRNVSDAEATWTLRVFAPDDEEHAYRLGVRTLPACETLEDGFEPNDTREAAADLPGDKAGADGVDGATTGADDPGQEPSEADAPLTVRLCPGDEDWFRVGLQAGWTLVAEFEGEVLEGAPALEILDEADRVVGTGKDAGAGAGAGQAAEAGAATRRLAATAQELPEGLYFVRLRGGEAAGTLAIRGAPPCPAGDDGNEDDDTAEAAKPVQNGGEPLSLRRCGGDDDWFRLELPAGESAQVSLAFTHEDGDLVLEAFDPKDLENPVEIGDESAAGKPGEVVALEAPADAAGVWLLRVRGATPDATNFYQLAIQDGQGGGGQGEDQEEEQQQAIDQQMQQLDEQTRDNLEAQKALEEGAALRIPGGKPW